jgi:hypothetical protein
MKRNVSVVRLAVRIKCRCNILIIKELPGLVGSGTPCTINLHKYLGGYVNHLLLADRAS